MTDKDDDAQAAFLKAKALSRWEGEGGSLGRPAAVALDDEDMRVLARLGAAVLLEWAALPDSIREALVHSASTLHAERDATRIRRAIALFLNDHGDR